MTSLTAALPCLTRPARLLSLLRIAASRRRTLRPSARHQRALRALDLTIARLLHMHRKSHWEHVYETKPSDTVSWFETAPTRSLAMLALAGLGADSAVVDVGGGDSLLAGALVEQGTRSVTVVDISGAALARAQVRIGPAAAGVTWIEGDITTLDLPVGGFDIWHDRAVFHFLTDPDDRARYIALAARSVRAGGAVVIGTFALDGPQRCSGLDIVQYSPSGLAAAFGDAFVLRHGVEDVHRTPSGAEQRFSWAVLARA